MKVLYAWNYHRGGNGSINATKATIEVARLNGIEVATFTRDSKDLPQNFRGRLEAGLSAFYAPGAVREFGAMLDSFKPDVVHVYDLFPLLSPWVLSACKRRGIPVVMTCDDYLLTCPARNHFREGKVCDLCVGGHEYNSVLHNCRENLTESLTLYLYTTMVRKLKLVSGGVDRFIVCSTFTGEWLSEHAEIEPAKMATVPHMVEMPATAADPAQGNYAAFAGRFVPEKGIDLFLEASKLCDCPFIMSRNQNYPVNISLPDDVNVVVTSGRDDLAEFYRNARMLVFPSRWFETFGLVGAESMSHGVPVVGARIGAVASLIEDGVDGVLFEPGNARDLADQVNRLWRDPELSRRLGAKAREKAVHLWSAEGHFRGLKGVYESCVAEAMARKK